MDIYEVLRVSTSADKKELQAKYLRMLDSYRLVASFAESPEVAEIAQQKIERLQELGREAQLQDELVEDTKIYSAEQEITAIRLALNSGSANGAQLRRNNISGKIDALPDSAEKHYLKAIVLLKSDSSFDGCRNALSEIQTAVRMDPQNEAYLGLMDALDEQFTEYEGKQKQIAVKAEQERLERERQSREALNAAERRRFWNAAGPCLGGVASLAIPVLSCLCCGSVCCNDCC